MKCINLRYKSLEKKRLLADKHLIKYCIAVNTLVGLDIFLIFCIANEDIHICSIDYTSLCSGKWESCMSAHLFNIIDPSRSLPPDHNLTSLFLFLPYLSFHLFISQYVSFTHANTIHCLISCFNPCLSHFPSLSYSLSLTSCDKSFCSRSLSLSLFCIRCSIYCVQTEY